VPLSTSKSPKNLKKINQKNIQKSQKKAEAASHGTKKRRRKELFHEFICKILKIQTNIFDFS